MKKIIAVFFVITVSSKVFSQLTAGASFGTFNIPGAGTKFKGFGPTVKIEHISNRQSAYLDVSFYKKGENRGQTTITESDGNYIGEADTKAIYRITNMQLGFKSVFGKDFFEKGFSFFVGGGIAVPLVKTTYKYTLPGYDISDSKFKDVIFGFHFNAGVQYNFESMIIELKSNFDLVLQPIVSGSSYVMSTSRLGVLLPLTK
jgi:opacity protein-like surface antigen